jgi:alkylation response protein AidB-like acyl-CoA dehydrogenase
VGVFIDEAYGGAGLGYFENCLIMEEFWAVDAGMGNSVLTGSFGSELLCMFGTKEIEKVIISNALLGK